MSVWKKVKKALAAPKFCTLYSCESCHIVRDSDDGWCPICKSEQKWMVIKSGKWGNFYQD